MIHTGVICVGTHRRSVFHTPDRLMEDQRPALEYRQIGLQIILKIRKIEHRQKFKTERYIGMLRVVKRLLQTSSGKDAGINQKIHDIAP